MNNNQHNLELRFCIQVHKKRNKSLTFIININQVKIL